MEQLDGTYPRDVDSLPQDSLALAHHGELLAGREHVLGGDLPALHGWGYLHEEAEPGVVLAHLVEPRVLAAGQIDGDPGLPLAEGLQL